MIDNEADAGCIVMGLWNNWCAVCRAKDVMSSPEFVCSGCGIEFRFIRASNERWLPEDFEHLRDIATATGLQLVER